MMPTLLKHAEQLMERAGPEGPGGFEFRQPNRRKPLGRPVPKQAIPRKPLEHPRAEEWPEDPITTTLPGGEESTISRRELYNIMYRNPYMLNYVPGKGRPHEFVLPGGRRVTYEGPGSYNPNIPSTEQAMGRPGSIGMHDEPARLHWADPKTWENPSEEGGKLLSPMDVARRMLTENQTQSWRSTGKARSKATGTLGRAAGFAVPNPRTGVEEIVVGNANDPSPTTGEKLNALSRTASGMITSPYYAAKDLLKGDLSFSGTGRMAANDILAYPNIEMGTNFGGNIEAKPKGADELRIKPTHWRGSGISGSGYNPVTGQQEMGPSHFDVAGLNYAATAQDPKSTPYQRLDANIMGPIMSLGEEAYRTAPFVVAGGLPGGYGATFGAGVTTPLTYGDVTGKRKQVRDIWDAQRATANPPAQPTSQQAPGTQMKTPTQLKPKVDKSGLRPASAFRPGALPGILKGGAIDPRLLIPSGQQPPGARPQTAPPVVPPAKPPEAPISPLSGPTPPLAPTPPISGPAAPKQPPVAPVAPGGPPVGPGAAGPTPTPEPQPQTGGMAAGMPPSAPPAGATVTPTDPAGAPGPPPAMPSPVGPTESPDAGTFASQWSMPQQDADALAAQIKGGKMPPDKLSGAVQQLAAHHLAKDIPEGANPQQYIGQKMQQLSQDGFTPEDLETIIPGWVAEGAPDAAGNKTDEPVDSSDPNLWDRFTGWFGSLKTDQKWAMALGIGLPILGLLNAFMGGNAMTTILSLVLGGLGIAHGLGAFDKLLGRNQGGGADDVFAGAEGAAAGEPAPGAPVGGPPPTTPVGGMPPGPINPDDVIMPGGASMGAPPVDPMAAAQPAAEMPAPAPVAPPAKQLNPAEEMGAVSKKHNWVNTFGSTPGETGQPGQFDSIEDATALITSWATPTMLGGNVSDTQMATLVRDMSPAARAAIAAQLKLPATRQKFGMMAGKLDTLLMWIQKADLLAQKQQKRPPVAA